MANLPVGVRRLMARPRLRASLSAISLLLLPRRDVAARRGFTPRSLYGVRLFASSAALIKSATALLV